MADLIITPPIEKGYTLNNPVVGYRSQAYKTDRALTALKLSAVLEGSGGQSVRWMIRFDTDRSAVGTKLITAGVTTTSVTTGSTDTVFDVSAIPINSWIWLEIEAVVPTVTNLEVTLKVKAT